MKNSLPGLLATLFLGGIAPLLAADSAKVTAAFNQVTHGSLQAADTYPAKAGTVLQDGEYLKTGVKSRAELELSNQSITRLGANTIFNYSAATNQIDLQAGTVLFSKPKDGEQLNIKTASVTAAVVGTTGFVQVHGHGFVFGLVEGHATLTIGGVDYSVGPGEILNFTPGNPPQIYSFNVPLFLKTSPLINRFGNNLPNQVYIDREVAEYNNLVSRGFIEASTSAFVPIINYAPPPPIIDHDSAGNALHQYNAPASQSSSFNP